MVAPMIDAFLRDRPHAFPLNLPNSGQAPDLPPDVVVEAMCVADGHGLHPRDQTRLPAVLAEWVRRISAAQEATVAGALSGVRAFHMDEYVGLPPSHRASFQRYMRERVAARLSVKEFNYLSGDASDPEHEAARYAALLRAHPLDLCCAGIGENGHLAFNDPPVADFDDPRDVKILALEPASRRQPVAEGHFAGIRDVPAHPIPDTSP